jgi:ATP-dependent DNA ligase
VADAVTSHLAAGTVIDGGMVVVVNGRIDFAALAHRGTKQRAAHPACLVVFDLLAERGQDPRGLPYSQRRTRLERLLAHTDDRLALMPMTTERAAARRRLTEHSDIGIEGVVSTHVEDGYLPGRRWWSKVKIRASVEAIIGGVGGHGGTQRLVLGRRDSAGRL